MLPTTYVCGLLTFLIVDLCVFMAQPILTVYVSLYTIEKDGTSRLFLPILTWCQSRPVTAASPSEPSVTVRRPREGEAVHGAGAHTGVTRHSQDG
jgi:hypothetical protein